jgi:hypothetical protein
MYQKKLRINFFQMLIVLSVNQLVLIAGFFKLIDDESESPEIVMVIVWYYS